MSASSPHRPIVPPAERALYDALFCDATPARGITATAAERLSSHSPIELRRLLDDTGAPSRLRLLAATELRRRGLPVSSRETLGVVVEVGMEEGVDVLAAYADGQVRYIAATGGVLAFEDAPPRIAFLGRRLVAAGQPIVPLIAPNTGTRGAPPTPGQARLTLLTGQGRFTGDGPLDALRNDGLAGPLIEAAQTLLAAIAQAMPLNTHASATAETCNPLSIN